MIGSCVSGGGGDNIGSGMVIKVNGAIGCAVVVVVVVVVEVAF